MSACLLLGERPSQLQRPGRPVDPYKRRAADPVILLYLIVQKSLLHSSCNDTVLLNACYMDKETNSRRL